MRKIKRIKISQEEEPKYIRRRKEVSLDPQVIQEMILSDIEFKEVSNSFKMSEEETADVWGTLFSECSGTPDEIRAVYLKYYLGYTERKIAKYLNTGQTMVRKIILSAINKVRVKLNLPEISNLVEFQTLSRNRIYGARVSKEKGS